MRIYSFKAKLNNPIKSIQDDETREMTCEWCSLTEEIDVNSQRGTKIFIKRVMHEKLIACAVIDRESRKTPEKLFGEFADQLGIKCRLVETKEETVVFLLEALDKAQSDYLIDNKDRYFEEFNLVNTDYRLHHMKESFKEQFIEKTYGKSEGIKRAGELLCSCSMIPEAERIFNYDLDSDFKGHPVHYSIVSDSGEQRNKMTGLLLGMLYKKGRLSQRRYLTFSVPRKSRFGINDDIVDELFIAQKGGAVVVRIETERDMTERDIINSDREELDTMLYYAKKHRKNTLLIVEISRKCTKLYEDVKKELQGMTLIKLDEENVSGKEAVKYLQRKAEGCSEKDVNSLLREINENAGTYLASELDIVFDKWYDKYLRNVVNSQYRDISGQQFEEGKKPVGSAYAELTGLIGLSNVKKIIKQIIDFHKARSIVRSFGLNDSKPAMHMIFSGNPGTAKTTVARLLARIMKDNGLLSVGDLVEVGRSDLVGKYVGWTAQIVKNKFKEAEGSILFIDEAYSLLDDRNGLFGDEAINTIVQEMENHRENTVVILAGYKEEMKKLTDRNPGLKSRISFKVDFPDYCSEELLKIFELMLSKSNMKASKGALDKVKDILSKAIEEDNFGNGRYVRNIVEQSIIKQSGRLMKMDPDEIDKNTVRLLIKEDIPEIKQKAIPKGIGF